jgi:formylmethanofuran dehydrogenase subunit E
MKSLEEYLQDAEVAHGHLCAGQVLGVRMAMLGMEKLGIEDPRGKDRKRLITYVEIDRCATDAISVVTGCRVGKRALKVLDWGKMAATFVDLETNRAFRISAKDSSKERAKELHPDLPNKNAQQMAGYKTMALNELFDVESVRVDVKPEDLPGYKGERIVCAQCGESIAFRREVRRDNMVVCRACSGERYYERI